MGGRRVFIVVLGLFVLCAGSACDPFDSAKLLPLDRGSHPMDSGEPDSSIDGGDGDAEAGMCEPIAEACNGLDDDCDGVSDTQDDNARTACEAIVQNAQVDCARVGGGARCVLRRCEDGFDSCDGDPSNGCERPYCFCNPCDDDGGIDDDGGAP